ncbi:hypothetical protein FB451DRAFT_1568578 [Mycena latifolia]|nr:hypothetical protein FB451DRAFT_1568578 [Mycena latifolia]
MPAFHLHRATVTNRATMDSELTPFKAGSHLSFILNIPDAIVARVVQYLPDTSIRAIALSCRGLNLIALSTFLAQNNILEPGVKCEVLFDGIYDKNTLSVVHALSIATFFHSTQSLSLIFLNPVLALVSRDMIRSTRLLKRLSPLRTVSIEFRNPICGDIVAMDGRTRTRWNSCFTNLWTTVLNNPSVVSFTIRTNGDLYSSETAPMLKKRNGGIQALWHGWRAIRNMVDLAISTRRTLFRPPARRPALTILNIDTQLMFLPGFYHLVVWTLQHFPITSLTLHALLSADKWSQVFKDIITTVPDLTELAIIEAEIEPPQLLRNLLRLPRLVHLTIDPPHPYARGFRLSVPVRDVPLFSDLTTLSVRSHYLPILLRHPDSLPRVESLDIMIAMSVLMSPDIFDDLAPIHRYPFFDISFRIDGFIFFYPPGLVRAMERCIDFALAMGKIKWGIVMVHVKKVVLDDTGCSVGAYPAFSRWLALFPALETVIWDGDSSEWAPSIPIQDDAVADVAGTDDSTSNVVSIPESWVTTVPNFLSLPDELLLAVFEHLSMELFDISLVSRRLHFLAIPVYLAQEKIFNLSTGHYSVTLAPYPSGRDALSVLNIALILPRPKSVHCSIHRAHHVYPSINQLRRLLSFVERLPFVDEVSLYLHAFPPDAGPALHFEGLQDRWSLLLGQLLNTIGAKSCTSLTVQGSLYLFPIVKVGNEHIPVEQTERVIISPPSHISLRTFTFEPSSWLSPVFLRWTIAALKQPHLTCIVLLIQTIEDQKYFHLLPAAIPRLSEVEIYMGLSSEPQSLRRSIIFDLLSRLHALQILRITDKYPTLGALSDIPSAVPPLPNLKSLTGAEHYVRDLLSSEDPLPSLQILQIHVLLFIGRDFNVADRPPILSSIFRHLRRSNLSPAVSLHGKFHSYITMPFPRGLDGLLGDDWAEWCPCITSLNLSVTWGVRPDPSDARMYRSALCARLERFPSLRELSFSDNTLHQSKEAEAQFVELVAKTAKRVLPNIEKLYVNGQEGKQF